MSANLLCSERLVRAVGFTFRFVYFCVFFSTRVMSALRVVFCVLVMCFLLIVVSMVVSSSAFDDLLKT